jgi:hypothetical protein
MRNKNHIPYVIFMVLGEFLIILDAGFVGYIMSKNMYIISPLNISFFWSFLIGGVIFRYIAEKFKRDEL